MSSENGEEGRVQDDRGELLARYRSRSGFDWRAHTPRALIIPSHAMVTWRRRVPRVSNFLT